MVKTNAPKTEMKVVNILKDGTILDSMKGVVLPEDLSEFVVRLVVNIEGENGEEK